MVRLKGQPSEVVEYVDLLQEHQVPCLLNLEGSLLRDLFETPSFPSSLPDRLVFPGGGVWTEDGRLKTGGTDPE